MDQPGRSLRQLEQRREERHPIERRRIKRHRINPPAQQPYAKKSGDYVADAKVHADNIKLKKRKDKSTKKWVPTAEQEADAWDALLF